MTELPEQIVTRPEELAECCAHLAACRRFGLDTEFVGEDSYHPRLCLIQVATPERLFLIDPFTIDSLDDFWKLIVDPARVVVTGSLKFGTATVKAVLHIPAPRLWAARPSAGSSLAVPTPSAITA